MNIVEKNWTLFEFDTIKFTTLNVDVNNILGLMDKIALILKIVNSK